MPKVKNEKAKCPTDSTDAREISTTSPTTSPAQSTEKTPQKNARVAAHGGSKLTTLYAVLACKRTVHITLAGKTAEVPLTWSAGMYGALPVFSHFEDAKRYADGHDVIMLHVVDHEYH